MCSSVTDSSSGWNMVLTETGTGHLSAFPTADLLFVQSDKEDRASAMMMFLPEGLLSLASPHGQLNMTLFPGTQKILGVSQPMWVTAHTVMEQVTLWMRG